MGFDCVYYEIFIIGPGKKKKHKKAQIATKFKHLLQQWLKTG